VAQLAKRRINMPLDFVTNPLFTIEDTNLDFGVAYEPTKMEGKKYVINDKTGKYIGIVGDGFTCASHPTFFNSIKEVIQDNRMPHELDNANVKISTSRNGAWALIDVTLPNVKHTIFTDKHQTEISERVIALHGVDGSCSNQVYQGAIDMFCTNGQISGDYDKIRKKNTSGFNIDRFIQELKDAKTNFDIRCSQMQRWAETPVRVNVKLLLEDIIKSDRQSKKMYSLAQQEFSKRGKNVFALYSAFTNYSSYADERNGFNIRNTGNDTQAETMWKREQEVAKWISAPRFKQLLVA
jgi:hypothetical protein|tara:strand:+ start:146 stop:1030 length:885 start_codon:yes stop_codon:yes gene_type:complete